MRTRRVSYSHLRRGGEAHTSVIEVVWEGFLPRVAAPAAWRPPVDVWETSSALHVKVEIAGLSERDVEVDLRGDLLVISGQRPWVAPRGDLHVHLSEIRYGPFLVEIEVADELCGAPVAWSYERGILQVSVQKEAAR